MSIYIHILVYMHTLLYIIYVQYQVRSFTDLYCLQHKHILLTHRTLDTCLNGLLPKLSICRHCYLRMEARQV